MDLVLLAYLQNAPSVHVWGALTPSVTVAAPMPGASYGDMDNARAEVKSLIGLFYFEHCVLALMKKSDH